MSHSVITVIGKDRIGIVYDVSKLLADNRLNIVNISQQLMDNFFTMIILVDTAQCPKSRQKCSICLPQRVKSWRWISACRMKTFSTPCTAFKGLNT